MLKLAITGGLCSGKSTVSAYLRQQGCPVLDADAIGHEILQGEAKAEVVAAFGAEILQDGKIVPARLAARVFTADSAALHALNHILHPRIMAAAGAEFVRLAAEGIPIAGLEAALLLEAKLTADFDRILVVVSDPEERLRRFVARGSGTREQALARMTHQMPDQEKIQHADFVVDNNHAPADTHCQLDAILAQLRPEVTS